LALREARADRLLALDDAVAKLVESLKSRGFVSPYLKYYVVAGEFPSLQEGDTFEFDDTIDKLAASARKIDVAKVRKEDITRMGGAPGDAEEE
jgi:ParB family chromosome partitioning protein